MMKMIGRTIFLLSMTMAFLTACSTPTVSSDDSDENSEKVEQEDRSSSSDMSNSKEADRSSSSEKKTESSSSEKTSESSSSSANEINCAALLEEHTGWSWNVPKVCRFNPDIEYGIMTDERDGKVYRTVKIGNQVWMAENLNYADSVKTPSLLERSWCFDDEPKNCDVTGRLYTWAAAIDSVELYRDMSIDCGSYKACTLPDTVYGICPSGWHLPTETEWEALITNIGGSISRNGQTWNSDVGQVLKSKTGWKEWSYFGNGTDTYGFSALPAGIRSSFDGSFHSDEADFWSSTENDEAVWSVWLYYGNSVANLISIAAKYNGCSVRCVKD